MTDDRRGRSREWARLLLSLMALALFALAAWKLGFFERNAPQKVVAEAERIASQRWLAPIFVLVYAILAAFALPVTVLAYGAGAIFGFLRGSLYVWIASMVGGTAGYYLARGALATAARRLLHAHHDKLRQLKKDNPALGVFRMQVAPIIPFGVATYGSAIAEVPVTQFLAGTAAGIIPGTLLSAFVGDRFVAGVSGRSHGALWLAIGISLLLLALSFLPSVIKKRRRS